MRKLILAGTTAVLLAGSGLAYAAAATAASGTTDTSALTRLADADNPPPPPPGGPGWGPGGPGHHGPRGEMMPPPPPPSKAAHFRIERGPLSIDVKCGDDDATKDCAAIALQLIDKAAALPMPPAPATQPAQ